MIVLSYFTKSFFEELINKNYDDKILKHYYTIMKDEEFFFIGNKDAYKNIVNKNKKILKLNQRKSNLIEKLINRPGWINTDLKIDDVTVLFKYLNSKNIILDFIFCSDSEKNKRTGELKKLKKKTLDISISPERILYNEQNILNKYKKKIQSHEINYNPKEKFEKVKEKKEFINWLHDISKIIFVCDKMLIYDRYIPSKLVDDYKPEKHWGSENYFKTLKYMSNLIEKSSYLHRKFECEILCILEKAPKEHNSKIKAKYDNKKRRIDEQHRLAKWNFFKEQVSEYLNCLPNINRKITIKDWHLWNNIHDRYWRFYYGGTLIKVLKFNPAFNFIQKFNSDPVKGKHYEFENLDKITKHLKEPKFQSLISDERNAYALEKAS